MIEQFSVQFIRFFIGIILARLLNPADYGVTGLIAVFIAISQVFILSGFGTALIQKKDRTDVDYSTVFYFNMLISIICWFLLFYFRKGIACFYNEPRLVDITPVLSLNLIIIAFAFVQRTKMTIELNFKTQAQASLIATIISGIIGITLAYMGYGVWALVYQFVTKNLINSILITHIEKWRPRLVFSLVSFKELFSFGSKMMLTNLLDAIYRNVYSLVIGKFFSSSDLGYYNRAKGFERLVSHNLTTIINKVSFPTLVHFKDNDQKLQKSLGRVIKMTVFVTMPIMLWMAVLSGPIILLTVKSQWAFSIPLLQILCFIGILYPIQLLNSTLLKIKGRSDLYLKIGILKKIFTTLSIIATFKISLKAMVIGSLISAALNLIISAHYTHKLLNYGLLKQIQDLYPNILLSSFTALCIYLSVSFFDNNLYKLIVGSLVGLIVYLTLATKLKFDEIKELKGVLRFIN